MRMKRRLRLASCSCTIIALGLATLAGSASAFPNFSDCPTSNPGVVSCLNIQSTRGSMDIKGFTVPLGDSFQIRGGLSFDANNEFQLNPPPGTNGVFSRPIQVPGGILGINFPIPGNAVTATATLAGPSSAIRILGLDVIMPLKLKLSNPLIGANCQIGSNANPVNLHLTVLTTSPPPPNRPISGQIGTISQPDPDTSVISGNLNVDNSFAIPGASHCGLGLGLIDALIDAKLKLPSTGGNNTIQIYNDVAIKAII